MSLQDIYERAYGDTAETEKVASEIEQQLEGFTDEEVIRLDAAGNLLDAYGMEFENGHAKLAASADLLDAIQDDDGEYDDDDDDDDDDLVIDEEGNAFQYLGNVHDDDDDDDYGDEKTAAEHDAAGRIQARAFMDELNRLQG
jgi:hypothetical protein